MSKIKRLIVLISDVLQAGIRSFTNQDVTMDTEKTLWCCYEEYEASPRFKR